jgi:hypothetical protein
MKTTEPLLAHLESKLFLATNSPAAQNARLREATSLNSRCISLQDLVSMKNVSTFLAGLTFFLATLHLPVALGTRWLSGDALQSAGRSL